jgi:hypothetical protein
VPEYPTKWPLLTQIGWTGPIKARRRFDIIDAYSVAFFDRELKGRSSPILERQKPYPEVKFKFFGVIWSNTVKKILSVSQVLSSDR